MTDDFGHESAVINGFCVDGWGAGPFLIVAGGRSFRFGDSDRFGPYLADRRGDPISNPYPGERSPFWRAHRIWASQGRKVAGDGKTCVWREPRPEKVWRVSARNSFVVEPGDPDGATIDATAEEVADWHERRAARGLPDLSGPRRV